MFALLLLGCPTGPTDTGKVDTADTVTDTEGETGETGETGDSGLDPETLRLAGQCDDADHWGAFTIDSNEDYAYVTGTVSNGVVPITVLENTLEEGDCIIWRKNNPFCDPGCDPGYTCDFDGSCVLYPEAQDLGTVDVYGLLEAVSMTPVTPGYTYFNTKVDNPPWMPGEAVELKSTGGVYDPITLYGVAPLPLVPPTMSWVVIQSQPLTVTWDVPTTTVRTEVALSLQIDQHGITPATIKCIFADDGSGDVPASAIDSLLSMGVSGFPNGSLARRTVDRTEIAGGTEGMGCVDLSLTSSRVANISIDGYTPCTKDEDCPDEQDCNEEMERCE